MALEEVDEAARCAATSLEVLTASTSYFCRASVGARGSPVQTTASGSMGGMKRVLFEVEMSYV